jgi:hypothetical protein
MSTLRAAAGELWQDLSRLQMASRNGPVGKPVCPAQVHTAGRDVRAHGSPGICWFPRGWRAWRGWLGNPLPSYVTAMMCKTRAHERQQVHWNSPPEGLCTTILTPWGGGEGMGLAWQTWAQGPPPPRRSSRFPHQSIGSLGAGIRNYLIFYL